MQDLVVSCIGCHDLFIFWNKIWIIFDQVVTISLTGFDDSQMDQIVENEKKSVIPNLDLHKNLHG